MVSSFLWNLRSIDSDLFCICFRFKEIPKRTLLFSVSRSLLYIIRFIYFYWSDFTHWEVSSIASWAPSQSFHSLPISFWSANEPVPIMLCQSQTNLDYLSMILAFIEFWASKLLFIYSIFLTLKNHVTQGLLSEQGRF